MEKEKESDVPEVTDEDVDRAMTLGGVLPHEMDAPDLRAAFRPWAEDMAQRFETLSQAGVQWGQDLPDGVSRGQVTNLHGHPLGYRFYLRDGGNVDLPFNWWAEYGGDARRAAVGPTVAEIMAGGSR